MSELNRYSDVKSNLILGGGKKEVLFSIVIPTYNRSSFLKYALESALNQTYKDDYEVLILENGLAVDGSTCEELVSRYDDPRINYYRNTENIGMHGNWNRACMLASGDYIVMLHDDDVLSPVFLKVISELVNIYPNSLISGGVNQFYASGTYCFDDPSKDSNAIILSKYNENDLFHLNIVGVTGSVFSRVCFLEYDGFKEDLFPCADYDFAVWMGKHYSVFRTKRILFAYRCLVNASSSNDVLNKMIAKSVNIIENDLCDKKSRAFEWKLLKRTRVIRRIQIYEKQWNVHLDRNFIFNECNLLPYKKNEEKSLLYIFLMNVYRFIWWLDFIKFYMRVKKVKLERK